MIRNFRLNFNHFFNSHILFKFESFDRIVYKRRIYQWNECLVIEWSVCNQIETNDQIVCNDWCNDKTIYFSFETFENSYDFKNILFSIKFLIDISRRFYLRLYLKSL